MLREAKGSIFKPKVTVFHFTDRPQAGKLYVYFFSCSKLALQITNGFVYAALFHSVSLRAVYQRFVKKSWQRTSNLESRQKKEVLKNRLFSNYFMLAVFISLIKFSKILFAVWRFVRSLKFYYKNNFCLSLHALKSIQPDFST